jgi:hypothetical protein
MAITLRRLLDELKDYPLDAKVWFILYDVETGKDTTPLVRFRFAEAAQDTPEYDDTKPATMVIISLSDEDEEDPEYVPRDQ